MKINFTHRPDREYKWEWYYSPQGDEAIEVYKWCDRTYGYPTRCDQSRWDRWGGWIKFRREEDAMLFVLKWT